MTPLSSSELHLSWTVTISAPVALRIWRLDPGQPDYQEIALIPGGATAFVDNDLISDSLYAYRLTLLPASCTTTRSPTTSLGGLMDVAGIITVASPACRIDHALSVVPVAASTWTSFIPRATSPRTRASGFVTIEPLL